ncbi:MAG: hypothetical protein A2W21_05565 [Betaproteobacteria bacterium RBG_16_66_20]|nr:MAG: hypothetical protein A2W21_05565 [Betaproteobacteria bacterium RBG_16_66_20]
MKMLIAGAGPAGLYLAYLVKRQLPGWSIRIVEQNPRDSTFGFGVVFSDRALEFLRGDDAETFDLITPAMQTWTNLTLVHRGTPLVIDGIGFAAIGRLQLLRLLQQRLASVSVRPEMSSLRNKFCWCGTTKLFPTLTQTFVSNEHGSFNAHHYRHSAGMSTFVVECDPATWGRAGFAAMDEAATLAYCERVFADTLAGHRLVSNKSVWRNFPNLRNARWSAGNTVLLGDAQRTAHFSIGSGTRLAMEDAIALTKALSESKNAIPEALAAFEAARRPIVEKLVAAADASGEWYERFPEHMRLAPRELAWSYLQRSGRVDPEKLRRIAPNFVGG